MRRIRFSLLQTGLAILSLGVLIGGWSVSLSAAEPERDGAWLVETNDKTGLRLLTREMTLHPAAEPRPALKYRFIPSDFEMVDGNAAIFYLQAMGFVDQDAARDQVSEFKKKERDKAREQGGDSNDYPPYSWIEMAPADLPQEEVKKYLKLYEWQERYLVEAAKRRHFDMDRQLSSVENPIAILLPEIQQARDVARVQSIRCALALSENRVDDAIKILGQQFGAARHLSQDDFLITQLVAAALLSMNWESTLYAVEHSGLPNLYWAVAALPRPFIDVRNAMEYESQLLLEQIKVLKEVDETLRPAGYWQVFLERFYKGWTTVIGYNVNFDHEAHERNIAQIVARIACSYPGACKYLIEQQGMSPEQVSAYPTAQVVFLAIKLRNEELSQGQLKFAYLPFWEGQEFLKRFQLDSQSDWNSTQWGWESYWWDLIATDVFAQVFAAQARAQQKIAMLQTVEAIRMYGALNDGKLPATLADLPVPAGVDPCTGLPLHYELIDGKGVITGQPFSHIQWRLIVQFAPAKSE